MADVLAPLIVLAAVVYVWVVQPIRWFRRRSRGPRGLGSRMVRLPDVWV